MYSKAETSRIRHEFWTTLGRYLSPVPSSSGEKVNWINYHTRVKDVYFRMHADNKLASIGISIEHNDPAMRDLYFDQLLELKTLLHEALNEEWEWHRHKTDPNGRMVASVSKVITGVSVFERDDWPQLISFFKPRIIALDSFWENARYSFD